MAVKTKNLNFVWSDFYEDILSTRKDFFENGYFADVTLISDDLKTFNVHRSILFPASDLLKELLLIKQFKTEATLFLKGIKSQFLEPILHFIYFGEVSVPEAQVKKFIKCAKDLDLKSFSGNVPLTKSNIDSSNVEKNSEILDMIIEKTESRLDHIINTPGPLNSELSEKKSSQIFYRSNTIQRPVEDEKEDEIQFYQCDKCEYKSKDTTNLKIHINRQHVRTSSVISKYSCNLCTYTNVNPNKMKIHKETKHLS